jgi:hypothetical protein
MMRVGEGRGSEGGWLKGGASHRRAAAAAAAAARGDVLVGDQTLTNGVVSITISAATGGISNYASTLGGVDLPLTQQWLYYNGSIGNAESSQASGAYIFRPNSSATYPVGSGVATVAIVTGPVVAEAQQVFSSYVSQVVRLWAGAPYAEMEWTVGPIPADYGHEVISRYATPLNTNGTWYTDSNCREMVPRALNYRATWPLNVTQPVAE